MLEVLEPGLQSTIQDAGRRGLAHLGLRRAGAADARALAASNLLIGNLAMDAALEMALLGGTFAVCRDGVIGLAGADMDARVPEQGRTLAPGHAHPMSAGTTYRVFMLGFAPGFAYLGTLPAELSLPRRPEPRTSVPAGSVAIAARQTGVYPVATPGGWHLIGRTDLPLWDPSADPPARLAPGDRVRFVAR